MDLQTAISNVRKSINKMDKISYSFMPNDNKKNKILLTALESVKTWKQLGAITTLRGDYLGFLQKPIEPIECPYQSYCSFMLDVGTLGWFFTYGMSLDGKTGYLYIIFRVPTLCYQQVNSYDELVKSTLFQLGGYVIYNGEKTNLSKLGSPIWCSCDYIDDKKGNLSLTLKNTDNTSDTNLLNFEFSSSHYLGNVDILTSFKDGKKYRTNTVSTTPAQKQLSSNGYSGISGAGTSYISFPYIEGYITNGSEELIQVVGWFDHQWATFEPSLRSGFVRWLATLKRFAKAPIPISWVWLTVQTKETQYNILYTGDRRDTRIGNTVNITGITKMTSAPNDNYVVEYKTTGKLTVLELLPHTIFPSKVKLEFSDGNIYILIGMGDGRMTMLDGSVNTEVPATLHDVSGNIIEGQGFIEVNKMHNPREDINYTVKLAGIPGYKSSDFYGDTKYSFAQSVSSILLLIFIAIMIVLLMVSIVKKVKKMNSNK
jgi:hypothetical protein